MTTKVLSSAPPSAECVYMVDDRPTDLILVRRLCENVGIKVKVFDSPSEFLADVPINARGCLIVDLLMPEMSGIELFNQLKQRGITLTTVIITGFADASSCRASFHSGAFDFIEKDFSPQEFLSVIRDALKDNHDQMEGLRLQDTRAHRIEDLTNRERDVAELLAQGQVLKEVGAKLKISVQTVSKHRSSIFNKLHVGNEVELHQVFAASRIRSGGSREGNLGNRSTIC